MKENISWWENLGVDNDVKYLFVFTIKLKNYKKKTNKK